MNLIHNLINFGRQHSFRRCWKFLGNPQDLKVLEYQRRCFAQTQQWTADDMIKHILDENVKKIVVIAGAGISTPSGIPDFRSPGTGLYDNLQKYKLPYPEAIFDISYFYHNPQPFFSLARELYPGNFTPNVAHFFVKLLQKKEKLQRMYTQNIDGLERISGIAPELLIEAHGSFITATCTVCKESYDGFAIRDKVISGEIPKCEKEWCKGVIKPDIVFFGEQLPSKFYHYMIDMCLADLLIVMGTSLEVEPFASIAEAVSENTPRLLINKECVGSFGYGNRKKDVTLIGDIVEELNKLIEKLGWTNELEKAKV